MLLRKLSMGKSFYRRKGIMNTGPSLLIRDMHVSLNTVQLKNLSRMKFLSFTLIKEYLEKKAF
jgi:hypothetical protein